MVRERGQKDKQRKEADGYEPFPLQREAIRGYGVTSFEKKMGSLQRELSGAVETARNAIAAQEQHASVESVEVAWVFGVGVWESCPGPLRLGWQSIWRKAGGERGGPTWERIG